MALKTMMATLAVTAGLGLAAGTAFAADPAVATATAPATAGGKAVVTRQAHYKDLNGAFKALNAELRKEDAPDRAVIAVSATKMQELATDLPTWFPKGSGPEAGVKTAAKAEIWTDAEGFGAAASGLQAETAKLEQVAMAGDLDAIKAQVRATGGACKACHDKFRGPELH